MYSLGSLIYTVLFKILKENGAPENNTQFSFLKEQGRF